MDRNELIKRVSVDGKRQPVEGLEGFYVRKLNWSQTRQLWKLESVDATSHIVRNCVVDETGSPVFVADSDLDNLDPEAFKTLSEAALRINQFGKGEAEAIAKN